MKKEKLKYFKKKLLQLKIKLLSGGHLKNAEDLKISPEDLADEADLATNIINQQVSFGIRSIELEKLKAIENALYYIENGTYGICEDCGEKIGIKRLEKQPWTTLCITHAEEREREMKRFSKVS